MALLLSSTWRIRGNDNKTSGTVILIIGNSWDGRSVPSGRPRLTLLTFTCPPDVVAELERLFRCPVVVAVDLPQDFERLSRTSCEALLRLAEDAPTSRGVNLVTYFAEPLRYMMVGSLAARDAYTLARPTGPEESVEAVGINDDLVAQVYLQLIGRPTTTTPDKQSAPIRRALSLLTLGRDALVTRNVLPILSAVDQRLPKRVDRPFTGHKGGTWMLSSYDIYSKTLEQYGPVDSAAQLLSRRGVRPVNSTCSKRYLDEFNTKPDAIGDKLVGHLRRRLPDVLPEQTDLWEKLGPWTGLDRHMTAHARYIASTERFIRKVEPDEIWVANQFSGERAAIDIARASGIPTVQVLHGTPGTEYRYLPLSTDVTIVPDSRWKDFFGQPYGEVRYLDETVDCEVPDQPIVPDRPVFVTGVVGVGGGILVNEAFSRRSILARLIAVAHATRGFTVRVHPRESPSQYQRIIDELGGSDKRNIRVDHGGYVEPVIASASVAVMIFSTVHRVCERYGVPIVSPRWYHSLAKEFLVQTKQSSIVNSSDLQKDVLRTHLERLGA